MSIDTTNPMTGLYRRLRGVGLTRSFVQKAILPEWWDDDLAMNPAGHAEGLLYLSRHLGLDLASLRDPDLPLSFREFGACKVKTSGGVADEDLALPRALATRSAQLAAFATGLAASPPPADPLLARREILGLGEPWVGLAGLTEYCWSLGIPVMHLSCFPAGRKRPDGLTVRVDGRPVIVLCKKSRFSAPLLFILAHELGHVALGHVDADGVLVDESIDRDAVDREEAEANAFAAGLLAGDEDTRLRTVGRWPDARQLAEMAGHHGRRIKVDPGHVILDYSRAMGKKLRALANAALTRVEPEGAGLETVRRALAANLDWSKLPETSSDFLMNACGAGCE